MWMNLPMTMRMTVKRTRMTPKMKVFYPPLFGVSQADQERREQKLKRKGGGLGGVPSGGLRSADCAVQSDIRRGPARGLLFSMSSWHKEEEYICFNDLFSFLMKDFKFVTWWLVLKFKTGAWLFLQIRVFSWLFLKFTLKYTGFAVRATSKPQPPSCKGLLLVA